MIPRTLLFTGKELKEMFSYSNSTDHSPIETFWHVEKTYHINITDPINKYGKIPLIEDDETVILKQKDLKGAVAGCDKGTFLALYMLSLTYKDDLFLGDEDTDECTRFMLSTMYDEDYNTIPCLQVDSWQDRGYVNEPLMIRPKEVDKIIEYLQKIKEHVHCGISKNPKKRN